MSKVSFAILAVAFALALLCAPAFANGQPSGAGSHVTSALVVHGAPQAHALARSSGGGDEGLKHDVVKWLAYILLGLIVLTVASGFLPPKPAYLRTIHHVLAFLLLAVALTHGILALTL